MYNLLITSENNVWEKGEYNFDRSRFTEYTDQEISENIGSLSPSVIEYLKSIPCLFAYEGASEPYRFGWLTNIVDIGQKISIEFELDANVNPIPYEDIKEKSSNLDIRKWEINRTHWAIKDVNLFDVLGILRENDKKIEKKIPVKKDDNLGQIKTVTGFIQKIFNLEKNEDCSVFYRGHSNKNYKLEPSLFRKDSVGNYLYLQNEDILFRELIVSNSTDFQEDIYTLDKLVRMQHYSLPTRLLDITSNPLISLYFSCVSNNANEKEDIDGEVIILSINRKLIKYYDSDTASCIANLARLPQLEKDSIDYGLTDRNLFNDQEAVRRLLHFIKEEKSFFTSNILPEDLKKIICVKSKMTNARIVSQSGAFLIFGHDSIMEEKGIEGIRVDRISIDSKSKIKILDELDRLNINERTLFPNIDNSSKYIRGKYKVAYKLD